MDLTDGRFLEHSRGMQDMKVVRTVVGMMTASNAQGMRYRERP
jgi:hypothetical protein